MSDLTAFTPLVDDFNQYLREQLSTLYPSSSPLHQATQYALLAGGKRVRPLLAMIVHSICGGRPEEIYPAALALEMIHTYSLIHDDLPCMDDDDFRRGHPTTHKVYSEAIALLAGDALLTDAFQVLAMSPVAKSTVLDAIVTLSRACGGQGMVLGQDSDMYWTGKPGYKQEDLYHIHNNKTAKLIAASCSIGSLFSPHQEYVATFSHFGEKLGLAFQIVDDLLDESLNIGKSAGKDKEQGKLTFLTLMSHREAEELAEKVTLEAFNTLRDIPLNTQALKLFAEALLQRNS